eukprot:CAMPEP_0116115398 /NCGR_PEP_ID=MMETSP0329-20121206/485_1 /TAXON_ID=697910 /ORGANISM="Pseudo-nitzschia arenysensis, Strain B593" /LENGTH=751 /DNA_ID=CAMNT_0003608827 /DNA_START=156 /DNA_END=2411 /DNA_ORIENTATION=-
MAQINNPSVRTDRLPPTSPIQRILIAHLTLHEACQNGKPLGEDASLEEISEEILFYHRGSPFGAREDDEWNLASNISHGSYSEEAVSFLGLCKALYALPSSLKTNNGDTEIDNDRSKSIYFGNSMLVFVPLESTLDLVAIVQVSRLYKNGVKSDTGSGNPLAISTSIERTHWLFCILHGGGILHRLDEGRSSGKTVDSVPRYPGMEQLFGLLKEIRVTKNHFSRRGANPTNSEEMIRRVAELEEEVKSCRETLPIKYLRRDLETHYNEYLSFFLEVCIRNGGAGRCLVETMPIPIAQDSGDHIIQVAPSSIEEQHMESIRESILQIFQSHTRDPQNESDLNSSLLGIAVFENSRLLESFSNSQKVDLSNGTVSLLMAYMASYRTKMSLVAMSIDGTTTSSLPEPQPGLLKRLLGPVVDKVPNHTAIPGKWDDIETSNKSLVGKTADDRGRFLSSPPPFMLGASDRLYSLSYDKNKQDIWAPRVHLPLPTETGWSIDDRFAVHMVVFEYLEFSFLIFIHLPSLENSGLSELPETTLLLMDLEEKLFETIVDTFGNNPTGSSASKSADVTSEPGQDIILVERTKARMVLLLDPKLQSPRGGKKMRQKAHNSKAKGQTWHFMGFGPRKKEEVSQSQSTNHRSKKVEWSALGLDCRHLFVSRLPLDICLAFDDMINEVQDAKCKRAPSSEQEGKDDDHSSSTTLELCTCMPYGWVYALATQEKEIYVFFDNSIYVTVADVQSAVQRIKERYITTT